MPPFFIDTGIFDKNVQPNLKDISGWHVCGVRPAGERTVSQTEVLAWMLLPPELYGMSTPTIEEPKC